MTHATPAPARRAWVEQVMGMPMSIHLRGAGVDAAEAADAVAAAFASLREMDRIFSTWREDSDIMRLRRGELAIEECNPLVAEALDDRRARPPGSPAVRSRRCCPATRATWSSTPPAWSRAGRSSAPRPCSRDCPRISACVNGAGDLAVVAHEDLPDEGPDAITWRIGIEDPADPSRTAEVVTLTRGAVATSGTAARGAHLYDPAGRRMVGRPGSTTVHGPSLLWADIWATALFVGGRGDGEAFARRRPTTSRPRSDEAP